MQKDFIFQLDNTPIHISYVTKQFFAQQEIKVFD